MRSEGDCVWQIPFEQAMLRDRRFIGSKAVHRVILIFQDLEALTQSASIRTGVNEMMTRFVAYRHGLRASEIGLLQRADVEVKQGRVSIHRLKGSISGVYPMQPDVLKTIRSYLRTRDDESPSLFLSHRNVPMGRFMLWELMQPYGETAGIPEEKRKFHGLQHSIATHWLDAGAALAFVKDWLGHANIQNTTIYARLTTATLDAQARPIFASHRVV